MLEAFTETNTIIADYEAQGFRRTRLNRGWF